VKTRLLILITSDPRTSPRPAEAVRIAAGIGAWQKVEAVLYFRDAAVLALGENAEELVDGENYLRYLPVVSERGESLFAERTAVTRHQLGEAPFKFATLDDGQLADLAAKSKYVMRF
jgi:sulfur relay (sulfurtransferase) DsrF/TusC family protein